MFNNSSNLYGSEWLAVVFNNRNKNYGAYELRAQSDNNTMKALFIAAPLFIMLFVGPVIYGKMHQTVDLPVTTQRTIKIAPNIIHEVEKKEIKKPEPVKSEPLPKQPVQATKFTSIKLVEETLMDPPTTADLLKTAIGPNTQAGKPAEGNLPPDIPIANGKGSEGVVAEDNEIHIGVDVYPEFPGGMAAWSRFIQKNLRYPNPAQEEGVQGKVYISFVVEKDGSITDVKLVKGIGYGCDDEALRVIKKSPKWNAGKQNNQTVRVRYNMPINYVMGN